MCFGISSHQWHKMCKRLERSLEREGSRSSVVDAQIKNAEREDEFIEQPSDGIVNECTCQCCPNSNYKLVRMRNGAKEQLRSELFLLLLIFFVFNESRNSFELATAQDYLAHLG